MRSKLDVAKIPNKYKQGTDKAAKAQLNKFIKKHKGVKHESKRH